MGLSQGRLSAARCTFRYDLDGNLTSKSKTGYTQTLAWNALGQLSSVTTNGSTTSYAYDGWGRRVKKTTGATVTGFLWDGDDLYADLDASQNPTAEYAFYPGTDQPHSVRKASFTYYYASELPGHVSGLFYGSTVSDSYRYTPWGLAEGTASTGWNRLRYMSREWDSESSLYYVRNRYYDPQLRRFISEDPIGLAGGINRYEFVGDDPINYRDPSGLQRPCPSCIPGIIVTAPRQYRLPPAGLVGSLLFGMMEGRANPGDEAMALKAFMSIAKDVAELKRDAVGVVRKTAKAVQTMSNDDQCRGAVLTTIGNVALDVGTVYGLRAGAALAKMGHRGMFSAERAAMLSIRNSFVTRNTGFLGGLTQTNQVSSLIVMASGHSGPVTPEFALKFAAGYLPFIGTGVAAWGAYEACSAAIDR